MQNKTLLCICRAVSSDFTRSLIDCVSILHTQEHTDIELMTQTKTDKSAKFVNSHTGLNIKHRPILDYDSLIEQAKDWEHLYEILDVSKFNEYDTLYIFGGLHFPQSNLIRNSNRAKNFPVDDRGQLKFRQFAHQIINVMAVHKAHVTLDIPLHELSYDTDEFSSKNLNVPQNPKSYFNYHVYPIPLYGMHRLDCLQYYHSKRTFLPFDVTDKCDDLTFGYTLYDYGDRYSYVSWINETAAQFKNVNIYVKNAIDKEKSNVVDKDTYLSKLNASDYTLIIPSYDTHCFSFYRFLEAIRADCLPLLHEKCYTVDVQNEYGFDMDILKKDISFIRNHREELLSELKSKFLKYHITFQSTGN